MKINRAYGLLVISFFVGCASTGGKVAPPEDSGKKASQGKYIETRINEDFDPLILRDDQIDPGKLASERKLAIEEKDGIHVVPENESTVFSEDLSRTQIDTVSASALQEAVPGWRVQICAIANEVKAREILLQAEDVFVTFENLKVYFTYDSPYYKVRLGDCTSRYQADQLLQISMERGFVDAWVVKTNVFRQEDLFHQSVYPIESPLDSTKSPDF